MEICISHEDTEESTASCYQVCQNGLKSANTCKYSIFKVFFLLQKLQLLNYLRKFL
jgi:hypothetical protein